MAAIFSAFIQYLAKFILFIAVAIAGGVCGKKLHERKAAQKTEEE